MACRDGVQQALRLSWRRTLLTNLPLALERGRGGSQLRRRAAPGRVRTTRAAETLWAPLVDAIYVATASTS
jgi:hypothetical protein